MRTALSAAVRLWCIVVGVLVVCALLSVGSVFADSVNPLPLSSKPQKPTIHADIVALDQLIVYNRFGSFDPYGMVFALRRDVTKAADEGELETVLSAKDCGLRTGAESGTGDLAPGKVRLRDCKRPRPLVLRANVGDILQLHIQNLLREKAPGVSETFCRHKVASGQKVSRNTLRGNVTDAQSLNSHFGEPLCDKSAANGKPMPVIEGESANWPFTRNLSFAVPGASLIYESVPGVCRGLNALEPNEQAICQFQLKTEGTHLFQSMAAATGGEGDGGSLTHGLFGALIVEKDGSYFRSQVSRGGFRAAWPEDPLKQAHIRMGQINFDATIDDSETDARMSGQNPCKAAATKGGLKVPVLEMVRTCNGVREIVHGDLNAVVVPHKGYKQGYGTDASASGQTPDSPEPVNLAKDYGPFREFVVIFHDELKTYYTKEFEDLEKFAQFSGIRDGFGINYGASGAGSIVLANRKKIGPARHCPECLYEEFFLESWANGDPALLESFPDDPSNVHHSYLNERIVFRNFHAGPKETHVFHLHAHQWFAGNDENRGAFLDSNTIGPQQGISYNINQGGMNVYRPKSVDPKTGGFWQTLGAGNRNRTPGDSIFHCHLYPHFAQGMWELWRTHDALEDGTRTLPDGQLEEGLSLKPAQWSTEEARLADAAKKRHGTSTAKGPRVWNNDAADPAAEGTPIPGLIPVPGQAAPLLPTYDELPDGALQAGFPGYPFYIAGEVGHRAPQAPLDIAVDNETDGKKLRDGGLGRHVIVDGTRATSIGHGNFPSAATVAQKLAIGDLTEEFEQLKIKLLPLSGTDLERRAMAFHHNGVLPGGTALSLLDYEGNAVTAPGQSSATSNLIDRVAYKSLPVSLPAFVENKKELPPYFPVNGAAAKPGAPFADPCGAPDGLRNAAMHDPFEGNWSVSGKSKYPTRRPKPFWDKVWGGGDRLIQFSLAPDFVAPDMTYDPGLTGFRRFRASAVQLDMVVNKAGWHDPQARINVPTVDSDLYKDGLDKKIGGTEPFYFRAYSGECIEFRHTNELPKDLALDDFQMKVPTDTIGQHIHLVKFDVTSADGSGNGFNYEDGTFAADELAARIKHSNMLTNVDTSALALETAEEKSLREKSFQAWTAKCQGKEELWRLKHNQFKECFQTTVQRWFADPILSSTGETAATAGANPIPPKSDRTLRTVFTHDHFGPSNIQQHGFYSALLIEPPNMAAQIYDAKRDGSGPGFGSTCNRKPDSAEGKCDTFAPKWSAKLRADYVAQTDDHKVTSSQCAQAAKAVTGLELPVNVESQAAVSPKVAFLAACQLVPPLVASEGDGLDDSKAENGIDTEQKSEHGVGARALVSTQDVFDAGDELGRDPLHPNYREFALAIADFALLYDGQNQSLAGNALSPLEEKGLDQLQLEATLAARSAPDIGVCGSSKQRKQGEIVPAKAVRCEKTFAGKQWLEKGAQALAEYRTNLRKKHGRPISPPERPEAISQTHHDPYLVNYRNDPIPVRIGEDGNGKNPADLGECPDRFNVSSWPVSASIRRQRGDADPRGDMANVFRSAEHGDPCTPILEHFAGERIMVRLIQGAQEVQHVFTVEGRTFRRNVDQNFAYGAWVEPNPDKDLGPTRWLQCMKAGMVDLPVQHSVWFGDSKRSRSEEWLARYRKLMAQCDNVRGEVSAQEIGISEHFEFAGVFSSDSGAVPESAKNVQDANTNPALGTRDALYHFGSVDAQWNGAWGLVRTYANTLVPDITKCLKENEKRGYKERAHECGLGPDGKIPTANDEHRLPQLPETIVTGEGVAASGRSTEGLAKLLRSPPVADTNSNLPSEPLPGLACPFLPSVSGGKNPVAYYQAKHGISGVVAISARDLDQPNQRLRGIAYDAAHGLYDPNGLLLVPLTEQQLRDATHNPAAFRSAVYNTERMSAQDDGSYDLGFDLVKLKTTINQAVNSRGFKPYVMRINAGDCLHLVVVNMLRNYQAGEKPAQVGSTRSGLTDWPGDAFLPDITKLNVDQYVTGEDKREKFEPDIGEVTPSASLALSIPVSVLSNVNDLPDPIGVNPRKALLPWDKSNSMVPGSSVMTIFGGKVGFEAKGLDMAIFNAQTKDASGIDSPSAKSGGTGSTQSSTLACRFGSGADQYQYVIWPVDWRACNETAGHISINVLGRKYCARTERVADNNSAPLPKHAELQACVANAVANKVEKVESDPKNELKLRVMPQALGVVPVKSLSDVIGHGTHGLAGSFIIEPADAKYAGRTEQPNVVSTVPAGSIGTLVPGSQFSAISSFNWQPLELGTQVSNVSTILNLDEVKLEPVTGYKYYVAETIRAVPDMDEQSLLWQDGLNLWDAYRRPFYVTGCNFEQGSQQCSSQDLIGGPMPDCVACDDSYDRGERGASYAAPALFARLRPVSTIPDKIGPDELKSQKKAVTIYAKNSDLSNWNQPTIFFDPNWASIPDGVVINLHDDTEAMIRIVAAQGRARQRAFVPLGVSYADIFPGFGAGHTSLLAPGKAVNAAVLAPAIDAGSDDVDFMWFDGPRQMLSNGAWGVVRVQEK